MYIFEIVCDLFRMQVSLPQTCINVFAEKDKNMLFWKLMYISLTARQDMNDRKTFTCLKINLGIKMENDVEDKFLFVKKNELKF